MQTESVPPKRRRWGPTLALGVLLAFAGFLTLVIAIDWLQGVSTHFWQESTCTIESSEVVDRGGEFEMVVRYRYHVRGESYVGDRYRQEYTGSASVSDAHRLAARHAPGETVPCWVDPDDPSRSYLRRAGILRGLWILLPLLFAAIGVGGLYMVHGPDDTIDDRAREPFGGAEPTRRKKLRPLKTSLIAFILFGAFFLFGFGMLIPMFLWPAFQVIEARSWVAVPCEVVSSGVRSHPGDDSTTYSVEALYRYRFDGQEYVSNRYRFLSGSSSGYEAKAEAAEAIPAGSRTECYVDPEDPYEAVLDRSFGLDFLFGLIPLLFGLIGAGGLSVLAIARSARRAAAQPSWLAPRPAPAEVTETGPVTLEPRSGPITKLVLSLILAGFWNGIVSIFLWQLIVSWRAGSPDWFLALFLIPFVLIGLLLLSAVPYSLLALVNPRPRVRLSTAVPRAGESLQIDWSFRGASGRIRSLKISLEGTRARTSTRGSESRSRSESFRSIEILDRHRGFPLQSGSVGSTLPADLEPTVDGEITWKLRLHGVIAYWPDVMEEYEVRVLGADR